MTPEQIADWVINNKETTDIKLFKSVLIDYINNVDFETNCSTCKFQTVSKYIEPCYGCDEYSNFQRK